MIKRRYYKQEHNDDGDDVSDSSSSSSSSSDSDSDAEAPEAQEEEQVEQDSEAEEEPEDVVLAEDGEQPSSTSIGSGYRSEDSSGNDVDVESPGLLLDADEGEAKNGRADPDNEAGMAQSDVAEGKDSILAESAFYILKCGAVFKCRVCPRIVCLSEKSLKGHLLSKRHRRSEKLLKEGRLKLMLNSDGEVEEDVETHAERYARTLALAQESSKPLKKNSGRQRQKLRLKRKKMGNGPDEEKVKQSKKGDGSNTGKEKRSNKGDGPEEEKEKRSKKGDGSDKGKVKLPKKGEGFDKEKVKRSKAGDGSSEKGKEKQSAKHQDKKRRRK